MKKIFTLIAVIMMAVGMYAETLVDFEQNQKIGITISGSTTIDAVRIKTNSLSTPGIKFGNSYLSNDAVNANYAKISVDGGFKAGDVVTIAGAFNNSDNSKKSAVDLFTYDGTSHTVLFTTQQFINGRITNDDPVKETYTLTSDVDTLYIGRNGNTGTFVTTLKVVRGEESTIGETKDPTAATIWDFTSLSENDKNNLDADENWTYNSESGRYSYNVAFAADAARANNIVLKANDTELEITKGLLFGRDGSMDAGKISIDEGKRLNFGGGKYRIILKELAKNDVLRIRMAGNGDGERGFAMINTDKTSFASTDMADVEETLTVEKNGDVIFETTGGLNVFALTINADLPNSGIAQLNYSNAQNAATFNLAGQKVAEGYKGIAIQNGKKVVLK